jgi:hypothetical protein
MLTAFFVGQIRRSFLFKPRPNTRWLSASRTAKALGLDVRLRFQQFADDVID